MQMRVLAVGQCGQVSGGRDGRLPTLGLLPLPCLLWLHSLLGSFG